ncbi:hypothetical protein JOE43_001965 [Frigoribacterium sp. PvP121]|nr:hypothetical protein [Frigoribacterium sp. PvP121]
MHARPAAAAAGGPCRQLLRDARRSGPHAAPATRSRSCRRARSTATSVRGTAQPAPRLPRGPSATPGACARERPLRRSRDTQQELPTRTLHGDERPRNGPAGTAPPPRTVGNSCGLRAGTAPTPLPRHAAGVADAHAPRRRASAERPSRHRASPADRRQLLRGARRDGRPAARVTVSRSCRPSRARDGRREGPSSGGREGAERGGPKSRGAGRGGAGRGPGRRGSEGRGVAGRGGPGRRGSVGEEVAGPGWARGGAGRWARKSPRGGRGGAGQRARAPRVATAVTMRSRA